MAKTFDDYSIIRANKLMSFDRAKQKHWNRVFSLRWTGMVMMVAVGTFGCLAILSLILTPLFNSIAIIWGLEYGSYVAFVCFPLMVLIPAAWCLRLSLFRPTPTYYVMVGMAVGALMAFLFNIPGGLWMLIELD